MDNIGGINKHTWAEMGSQPYPELSMEDVDAKRAEIAGDLLERAGLLNMMAEKGVVSPEAFEAVLTDVEKLRGTLMLSERIALDVVTQIRHAASKNSMWLASQEQSL